MPNEQTVLAVERLRDDLVDIRRDIRQRYRTPERPVVAAAVKDKVTRAAESWLVELRQELEAGGVPEQHIADLSVRFQRLLLHAERAAQRAQYERELTAILKGYTQDIVIPLKQAVRGGHQPAAVPPRGAAGGFAPTAFVGHSFSPEDASIVACVLRSLDAIGIGVLTGERPQANTISAKVMRRIERQHVFVGIFTRRERLASGKGWTTSAWIIEEKTYALAKGKPLILLREEDVESIGGIHGDYQHVTFKRTDLLELSLNLLSYFSVTAVDLQ